MPVINRLAKERPPINSGSGLGTGAAELPEAVAWGISATERCEVGRLAPSVRPGLTNAAMPLPLLLALTPLPSDGFVPFVPPVAVGASGSENLSIGAVETFDAQGRAAVLARDLPRAWSGTYRPYGSPEAMPVELRLESLNAMGQMVDLRGQLTIAGVTTPIQGNLNAKSDQLDLLLLGDSLPAGMEPGGTVMGLEGFSLSAWQAPRLVTLGGRLQLVPQLSVAPASSRPDGTPSIRGLW